MKNPKLIKTDEGYSVTYGTTTIGAKGGREEINKAIKKHVASLLFHSNRKSVHAINAAKAAFKLTGGMPPTHETVSFRSDGKDHIDVYVNGVLRKNCKGSMGEVVTDWIVEQQEEAKKALDMAIRLLELIDEDYPSLD